MYTSQVDNPYMQKLIVPSLDSEDTMSTVAPAPAPAAIDFSATTSDATNVTKPDALPLVNKSSLKKEGTGLTVETTAKPTLDAQTRKWFHLTQAQWDALPDEEKQAKTEIALKGIVDSYNENQEKLG